jgi:hypothetical protein
MTVRVTVSTICAVALLLASPGTKAMAQDAKSPVAIVAGLSCGVFAPEIHANRRLSACEGDHGMGSAVLCQQDHLVKDSYIVSPNDQYRMYFQGDGALIVVDISDYEHPILEYQVFAPFDDPGSLEVSVPDWIAGCEAGFLCAINRDDELVVIVPPDHELAGRTSIELAELAKIPMLMQQKGSGVRSVLEDAMRTAGLRRRDLPVRMELGLQQSVKAAVLDGIGITVVSRLAVQREVEEGSLVALELLGPGIARDFQVVTREGRTLGRASAAFLEFARAELAVG